ncbi:hypothetical protein IRZ70_11465 [Pseudomonas monteilii]|nr:hypothetical protein [Pseudomonas monteilii]
MRAVSPVLRLPQHQSFTLKAKERSATRRLIKAADINLAGQRSQASGQGVVPRKPVINEGFEHGDVLPTSQLQRCDDFTFFGHGRSLAAISRQ